MHNKNSGHLTQRFDKKGKEERIRGKQIYIEKSIGMFIPSKGTIKVVMLQSNPKFQPRQMPDDSEKIYIGRYTEKKKRL